MDLVVADKISKSLDGSPILTDVSLSVRAGEILGILGPNGAGKTTFLNCIAGVWSPLAGSITIDGLDRYRDGLAIRQFTFFLPDHPYAHPHESGRDHLELVAEIYGVAPDIALRQIDDLATAFELTQIFDDPVGVYSNGQYKKLCIAGALVSNARLLILDEPFTGEIDPPGTSTFKVILRELCHKKGVTCVVSTQIVPIAEEVCDRVAILHEGRVKAVGTSREIVDAFGFVEGGLERVLWEVAGKKGVAAGLDYVDAVKHSGGE